MTKRSLDSSADSFVGTSSTLYHTPLVVNFSCFVTCTSEFCAGSRTEIGDSIVRMCIPGFELPCIFVGINPKDQAIEIYMECDGVPLTRLMRTLEDMGMVRVSIFTFGSSPMTNGAPEALARIKYRMGCRCGFIGFSKGMPTVNEDPDFDIRDAFSNWIEFTADQISSLLAANESKPYEVVEWCVVMCFGDSSTLERRLKALKIKTFSSRQYYIKGIECMRMPMTARIFLEIEPIVKTVLLRCLMAELAPLRVEIMTFPMNQQARALRYVSDLGGILIEWGNLSKVEVCARSIVSPCSSSIITRFTQQDLAVWDCVVIETPSMHWSVNERDAELDRLRNDALVMKMENKLLQEESANYKQQCDRLLTAVGELKSECNQLRRELEFLKSADNSRSTQSNEDGSLIGWYEWETMRSSLEERDQCIAQLKARLNEADTQIRKLQTGEMVEDDQGRWICVSGDETVSALNKKIKMLEQNLVSEYEGGLVFDEERNKFVETGGRTWTRVQWQARELEVYRYVFGSITVRDSFNELEFAVRTSRIEDACI